MDDLSINPQGDESPNGHVDQSTDPIDGLKAHRDKLEAEVDNGYRALIAAGVNPQEPPASMIVVGTLIEALFGDDENDPQRITFDIRLAANRLKILSQVDPDEVKAAHAPAKRFRSERRGRHR